MSIDAGHMTQAHTHNAFIDVCLNRQCVFLTVMTLCVHTEWTPTSPSLHRGLFYWNDALCAFIFYRNSLRCTSIVPLALQWLSEWALIGTLCPLALPRAAHPTEPSEELLRSEFITRSSFYWSQLELKGLGWKDSHWRLWHDRKLYFWQKAWKILTHTSDVL